MLKCFELDSNQIRIRDILNDKNFLEIEIFAISDANPNCNKSHFTLESMQKGLESFNDKPMLGFSINRVILSLITAELLMIQKNKWITGIILTENRF